MHIVERIRQQCQHNSDSLDAHTHGHYYECSGTAAVSALLQILIRIQWS